MTIARYQIGVDVLGFPIYIEHEVYRGKDVDYRFRPVQKYWIRVIEKIVKQH